MIPTNYFKRYPIVVTLILFSVFSCENKGKTYKVEEKPLVEAVYVSGEIAPIYEYKIFSSVEGRLLEAYVQEGDSVKAGQPLFLIEDETQRAKMVYASELYKIAQINNSQQSPILAELEAGLSNAKARLREDSVNYFRAVQLWKEKAISKTDLDRFAYTYEVSMNDFTARNNTFFKTKNQMQLELKNAESQFRINQFDQGNYLISSYTSGLMLEIYKEPGELVRRNDMVGLVGNTQNVILRLNVDIQDIGKIKTGQAVVIEMDTYKDELFDGKVTKIYPKVQVKDRTFLIEAMFVKPPPQIFYGSTVEANIIIQKKEHAMVIPKKLLVEESYVWIKNKGKKEKIKIRKGIENYDWVEVLGGLDTESKILEP